MRNLAALHRQIHAQWAHIVEDSGVQYKAHDFLPAGIKLFGSSTKTQLSSEVGVITKVLYMSPAKESGVEMCSPYATRACKSVCLGHNSGRLAMAPHKRARLWKTALFLGNYDYFCALAMCEVDALARKAATLHLEPAIRFDGSTDTGIGFNYAAVRPELRFYDYTKDAQRARRSLQCANYDVTLSYNGENWVDCAHFLGAGGRVAVVFDVQKGAELPDFLDGFPVVDGDQHDATWTHAPGVVIGLRLKAAANKQKMRKLGLGSGFVVSPAEHSR